jgi:SAM-dependent methyltransferase
VLEIGAGMGTRTVHFLPRARYVAADVNHHYLAYLTNMALGKPYLEVVKLDVLDNESFKTLTGQFDTAICISILENLTDERLALQNIYSALNPGGKAVVMVPQGEWLYSSLDQVTNHHRRYEKKEIIRLLEETGFKIISVRDFNRISVLAWLLNGKILQRKHFSHLQLKLLDLMTPLIRQVDRFLPWEGLNVVAVGQK